MFLLLFIASVFVFDFCWLDDADGTCGTGAEDADADADDLLCPIYGFPPSLLLMDKRHFFRYKQVPEPYQEDGAPPMTDDREDEMVTLIELHNL